ncbi:hypothetical protein N1851_028500 [Merluccius polli]|uniref:SCAN box domain-containing protein n=1 Tax=Merluccius polli TaxID=89951 RepID=A0AA47NTG1_MERPO|nr:hypothetical protein N1851_028500 [Merluccius polli]
MDEFAQVPTLEKLDRCTKEDLLVLAAVFDVAVPTHALKAEVKRVLSEKLVERGILAVRPQPQSDGASGGLEGEVEVEAATAQRTPRVWAEVGAEAPAPTLDPRLIHSVDPIALIQAGVETEDLKLALRLREVELETKTCEVELMHLRIRAKELDRPSPPVTSTPVSMRFSTVSSDNFDVSKHIGLVPPFRESEVDSYFRAFERIAATLKWPRTVWSLLLQCKLVGKAQEVCASLSIDDSLNYDIVKATVLRAYELVPEAYRQKFRSREKSANQTHVEFAREKTVLLDKWCSACKVTTFDQLRELILLEEFKKCLPERVVVYLNEQKVETMSKAAVCADEFVLTHLRRDHLQISSAKTSKVQFRPSLRSSPSFSESRECFYCHEVGHLIATCPTLQRKESQNTKRPKSIGFVQSTPERLIDSSESDEDKIDKCYKPFIHQGSVSLTGQDEDQVPIVILRDTGATQSLML